MATKGKESSWPMSSSMPCSNSTCSFLKNSTKTMKTTVLQHDETDCAAACMASIARYYGRDIPLTIIREACGTSSSGTSLKGLLDAARRTGFAAAAYKSDDKKAENLTGLGRPAILHVINRRRDLHFVVLYSASAKNMTV